MQKGKPVLTRLATASQASGHQLGCSIKNSRKPDAPKMLAVSFLTFFDSSKIERAIAELCGCRD